LHRQPPAAARSPISSGKRIGSVCFFDQVKRTNPATL
jgi:hypothetical protein